MQFLKAILPILRDLLATLVFVGVFWATDNIYLAAVFGIACGIGQFFWMKFRGHPVGPLHWLSLVLITVLGVTTIVTHNPHYIMLKPTLIWLAVGAVMLRRDWMAPYLPAIVTDNLDDEHIMRAGFAWAILMFALAGLNLLVAFTMTAKFWSVYAVAVPAVAMVALFVTQYFKFRSRIVKTIRARKAASDARQAA